MQATELFHQDGRTAGVWYCGECKIVRRTEKEAAECCRPYVCTYCGTDVPRKNFRTACPDCIRKRSNAMEALKFKEAEKVTSWDGWIFSEGHGEEFFREPEDLFDWIEGQRDEGDDTPLPTYAWTCDPVQFARLEIGDLTERICESGDAYEDFDPETLDGIPELEAALEEFNRANEKVVSWRPNYRRALVFNSSEKGERV